MSVLAIQQTHTHLAQLREDFMVKFGIYPSVMYIGSELFSRGWPVTHMFPRPKVEAIDSTLVIEQPKLPGCAVVIIKPPEAKKAA